MFVGAAATVGCLRLAKRPDRWISSYAGDDTTDRVLGAPCPTRPALKKRRKRLRTYC